MEIPKGSKIVENLKPYVLNRVANNLYFHQILTYQRK